MGDTAVERQAVAAAVEDEGARPVWFEELGRDADPEEAYLVGALPSLSSVAMRSVSLSRSSRQAQGRSS